MENFESYIRTRAQLACTKFSLKYEDILTFDRRGFRMFLNEDQHMDVDFKTHTADKIGVWGYMYKDNDAGGELFSRYVYLNVKEDFASSWKDIADLVSLFFQIRDFL